MKPLPVSRGSGFTLIEVTLAVGISAVALVGLLAMLPQGVMTMKRATDTAIEARIHQQIVAEISQVEWQDRNDFDFRSPLGNVRFYDAEGIRVPSSESNDAIYAARLILPGATGPNSNPLPTRLGGGNPVLFDSKLQSGGGGAYQGDDPVQLVIMEITSAPSVRTNSDFDQASNWPGIRTYRSTMVRLVDQVTGSRPNP